MKRLLAVLIMLALSACVAAAAGGDRSFTFVQIADTQLGFSTDNRDLSPEIDNFRKAVEHINRLRPAFVLISGDLINAPHDPGQIRAFWRVAREISPGIPLYLVPGNHDIGQAAEDSIRSYRRLFGSDYYSFRHNGAEFIVLNSCLIHDPDSAPALRSAQRKWLEEQLAAARGRKPTHIFVCTHHSWFLSAPDEKDDYFNIPRSQRQDYLKLFNSYGVGFALAGHLHRESIAHAGALNMITTPALSKALGPDPVGMRIFRVHGDRIEHTYYPLDKVPAHLGSDVVRSPLSASETGRELSAVSPLPSASPLLCFSTLHSPLSTTRSPAPRLWWTSVEFCGTLVGKRLLNER